TDYCDGDQEGCAWTGDPHESASVRADVNIRPWHWDGDRLITSSTVGDSVTTMSRRFPSKRRVRGVQFATQQSGPVQLVPDPDFAAPLATHWVPVGDVVAMEHSEDFATTLGTAVRVLRSSGLNTWAELGDAYPTWADLEAGDPSTGDPTWEFLEGDSTVIGGGGIEQRTAVQVSGSGRVRAAARVYADHALAAPLTLQILSANGDVLAERDQVVTAGKIVEWSVGYTLGEVPTLHQTWADIRSGGGGIEQRTAVQVSGSGRVRAAARVYADHALAAPLTLQILSANGDVLAERDQVVTAGKIVEWSVGYTVGEVPTLHQTWADI